MFHRAARKGFLLLWLWFYILTLGDISVNERSYLTLREIYKVNHEINQLQKAKEE